MGAQIGDLKTFFMKAFSDSYFLNRDRVEKLQREVSANSVRWQQSKTVIRGILRHRSAISKKKGIQIGGPSTEEEFKAVTGASPGEDFSLHCGVKENV